ncbi:MULTISPECIES: M42 family metallopeptidase [unclassified Devosia]|uniref:M42 family metallopeptidase n=1 Tax=unclassified Devosia TaxID=196773 RepID=UPI00155322C8|nr:MULTISPECIES: M42 family metallopeptidase [unclassified Devosia]
MRDQSLQFLRDLVQTPSPSGYEQRVAQRYRSYVEPLADAVSVDLHGNVIAALNPAASTKIMLAGHMDEIGFILHYIGEEGLLYFSAIGGHDSVIPVGQTMWVHGRNGRVAGVVGRKAIHLMDPDELKEKPKLKELWIDIGAGSRAEAQAVVALGDVVTYQQEFQPLLGDRAVGRAFDNKAGLFIVAEALRLLAENGGLHPEVGVYAVGTVQEEIGSRGARTAAFAIGAQSGIAVDMEHAIDYPGVSPSQHGQLELGKGPTVSLGANTNRVLFDLVTQAAEREAIPYQVQVAPGATPTDANALQLNQAGMATGLLGVPLRYMHTPGEVVSLTDVEHCARLVAAYCRMVTPETDFTPR